MNNWKRLFVGGILFLVLWLSMPAPSLAQDAGVNIFGPDVIYDVYLENGDNKGLVIRQINIAGVTTVSGKTMLIIQSRPVGNNVAKGYVLLDKVTAILPATAFSVSRLSN